MTIKEIDEKLLEGQSLKEIAQAYSEIANLKIKRIRSAVERNRVFFDEISRVYGLVKAFALKRRVAITKPKKRLFILITSNYRFYGNINSSLTKYFTSSTRELTDADKIVLGKGGIEFFKASKLLPNYQELLLKDDMPTNEELASLVSQCSEYNQVLIFHSRFKSLLTQKPTFTDITAPDSSLASRHSLTSNDEARNEYTRFIFEPELPKILSFFDSQIITLLLEQTFLESELSRTASRFISMDQAETEANKYIKQQRTLKSYAKRTLENNTILENYASMAVAIKSNI